MTDVQTRAGDVKQKRQLQLVDESGFYIECCVWAEVAESFEAVTAQSPVMAIKGARVVQYQGGHQLTMDQEAVYTINPVHDRTKELAAWF